MNQKTKAILTAILTNVFTVLASLIIAVYFSELAIHITLPVWVHWAMGLVLALLLITGQNMSDYKNIQRRNKK